jgi:hypothetical protein
MRTVIASADSSTLTTALFTFVGVLVAAIATMVVGIINYRQARSGQLTDRLTKAVEQLGSNNPQVRMGAVFALEQIAANGRSPDDKHQSPVAGRFASLIRPRSQSTPTRNQSYVAAMLTALVRFRSLETTTPEGAALKFRVPDVQAALTVLCRPPVCRDHEKSDEKGRLDLSRSDLQRASLRNAKLQNADLSGTSLQGADLRGAQLQGAVLSAKLGPAASRYRDGADLSGANMTGADLNGADLHRAIWDLSTSWPDDELSCWVGENSTKIETGDFCIDGHR